MLKLLDQIPIWKDLRALPKRVAELEARLAALEKKPTVASHIGTCATCGAPARIVDVRDHPIFGEMGMKLRTVECENGHRQDYRWDPSKEE